MARIPRKSWLICLVVVVSLATCLADDETSMHGSPPRIEAITRPSEDVTLSFVRPGQIAKVFVKEGDPVKVGQVLLQQDDAVERAELEQLKLQAENLTRVQASEAQLKQKKVDLKKLEWAEKRGAATELEVEHARLDVLISELTLELTRFQQDQDRRKYIQAKLTIDRMSLNSPIAGVVEQIAIEPGEAVDAWVQVIRVVKIDPLWIDVPVPRTLAMKLRRGGAARVELGPAGAVVVGKIIHIAAVADAASNTLTVRVEMPNPTRRPGGEHVKIYFPRHVAGGKSHAIASPSASEKSK
ncbi:MAG: efflux RND transporter periplasmic adaptor subunit [Planctomycetota bacterium]|nr:efflux RND transporter periplasmic adaptor subunit [Planctomycetota bacterium]